MMRLRNDFLERMLAALGDFVIRHPRAVICFALLLSLASVYVSVTRLAFLTEQNALVSNELEYNRRYLSFREKFGDLDHLYVVIEVDEIEPAFAAADAIAEELGRMPEHVKEIFHRVSIEPRHALLFLPTPLLEKLASMLEENGDVASAFGRVSDLPSFCEFVADNLDAELARGKPDLARLGLDGLRRFIDGLEDGLDGKPVELPSPFEHCPTTIAPTPAWLSALGDDPLKGVDLKKLLTRVCSQGYLYTGELLFVRILPKKNFETLEVIREPLRLIRAVLDGVRERFPGMRIGLTGRPVLQADEMETTNDDMTRAAIFATLCVVVLFVIFFREIRRPIYAAFALVIGLATTFGVVTLTIGYLNLLTMVFAVMLVSMAMEFGIHLIARYQEELAVTGDVETSIRNALMTAGKGNITGATTTAAAFYTTLFVDFKGLAELGFIAGTGLLICMLSMNTVLPAFLVIFDRRRTSRPIPAPLRLRFLGTLASRPAVTLSCFAVLTLAGVPWIREVRFDANLLNLQAKGLPSVEYENLVLEKPGLKTWFAAFVVESIEDVRRLRDELSKPEYARVVSGVECILDYVPENQEEKTVVIERIAAALEKADDPDAKAAREAAARTLEVEKLESALERILDRFEALLSGTLRLDGEGAEILETITGDLDDLIVRLGEEPELATTRLGGVQEQWRARFDEALASLSEMVPPLPITLESVDPSLRQRVASKNGEYLVLGFPAENIWVGSHMDDFIETIRRIDPEVTGVPVQVFESTRLMRRGFLKAAIYSLVAVFVLIVIDVWSLVFALLAMLPVGLGLLWVAELMPALNMSFNLANFFSIPILIGEGINGGVHIIHRFREDRSALVATRSTGSAVVLSYLNSLAGFGMLLFASHRGLASLGGMMVLGSAASLVSSSLVLPAILRLVERRRWHAD